MRFRRLPSWMWALCLVTASVWATSFIFPIQRWVRSAADSSWQFTLANGGVRIVRSKLLAPGTPGPGKGIDDLSRMWNLRGSGGFAWSASERSFPDGRRVSDHEAGMPLFAPLFVTLVLQLFGKLRRQVAGTRFGWILLREIIRPGDWDSSRTWRRRLWRIFIAVPSGVGGILAVVWIVSYAGAGPMQFYEGLGDSGHVSWQENGFSLNSGNPYLEPTFNIWIYNGHVSLGRTRRIPKDAILPNESTSFLGLGWSSVAMPSHWECTAPPPEVLRSILTTNELKEQFWVPVWTIVLPVLMLPGAALFRGPWRRAIQRISGYCCKCSYNLAGLNKARCPECGTTFDPALLVRLHRIEYRGSEETGGGNAGRRAIIGPEERSLVSSPLTSKTVGS